METDASGSRGHMVLRVGHMPHEAHHMGRAVERGTWPLFTAGHLCPSQEGTERGSFRRGPACWEGPLAAPLGRLLQADAPCPETSRGEGTVCQGIITAP